MHYTRYNLYPLGPVRGRSGKVVQPKLSGTPILDPTASTIGRKLDLRLLHFSGACSNTSLVQQTTNQTKCVYNFCKIQQIPFCMYAIENCPISIIQRTHCKPWRFRIDKRTSEKGKHLPRWKGPYQIKAQAGGRKIHHTSESLLLCIGTSVISKCFRLQGGEMERKKENDFFWDASAKRMPMGLSRNSM